MVFKSGMRINQGKYVLATLIGRGGHAEVWEATMKGALDFSQQVVLKILHERGLEQGLRDELVFEARLGVLLNHPYIIKVFDVGIHEDAIYLAMEKVEGADLADLLHQQMLLRGKALPWELVAWLTRDIAQALDYAHRKRGNDGSPLGIIHRDVKPHNILVSYEGYPKLIDFGVARQKQSTVKTATNAIKGTPAYMSPEQIRAGELDQRVDIYALGAVMYELCSGQKPFTQEDVYSLLYEIVNTPFPPLDTLTQDIPQELVSLVHQMLDKDKEHRPTSAESVSRSLEHILLTHAPDFARNDLCELIDDILMSLEPGTQSKTYDVPSTDSFRPTKPKQQTSQSAPVDAGHTRSLNKQNETATTNLQPPTGILETPKSLTKIDEPETPPKESTSRLVWFFPLVILALLGGWYRLSDRGTSPSSRQPNKAIDAGVSKQSILPEKPAVRPNIRKKKKKQTNKHSIPARVTPPNARPKARSSRKKQPVYRRTIRPKRKRTRIPRRRTKPIIKVGNVLLTMRPTCTIFSRGKKMGQADGLFLTRPAGVHTFQCVNMKRYIRMPLSLTFTAGKTTNITRTIQMGTLFVLSFPWSTVFFPPFGQIGQSQSPIRIPTGTHRIILFKKGNSTEKRTIRVTIRHGSITRTPVIRW